MKKISHMWLNKRNGPFRCYFTPQPTHSLPNKKVPGVLDINGAYFIKIDKTAVALDSKSFEQLIGYLLMYYHILDIIFPPLLKIVLRFLETNENHFLK
jgi:hypothetical protein